MTPEHDFSADVLTAVEACRPDSDDTSLAEVAAILNRQPPERVAALRKSVEHVDRAIMSATQGLRVPGGLPVPEGLADRIMANLRAVQDADRVEVAGRVEGTVDAAPATRWQRGRWMAAGASLALAAILLVAVGLWLSRGSLDAEQLQAEATQIYSSDDHNAQLAGGEAPFVVTGLSANAVLGWRAAKVLNRDAVVYELAKGRVRGTLYVMPLRSLWGPTLKNLSSRPVPQSTAGITIAVWADDSYVYVMVVKGSERDFERFFPRNVSA